MLHGLIEYLMRLQAGCCCCSSYCIPLPALLLLLPAALLPGCSCSRLSTSPVLLYWDTIVRAKLGMCCAARLLPMCLWTHQGWQ